MARAHALVHDLLRPSSGGVTFMVMVEGCSASSPPLGRDPSVDRDLHHHGEEKALPCRSGQPPSTCHVEARNGHSPMSHRLMIPSKGAKITSTWKTNVVGIKAKPSIQEVIHPTSVVIKHSIWFDKEVWHGI